MNPSEHEERGTTERVLSLLGLLQQRQVWTGPELAERLGVTTRTVRRDANRLRALGYLIEASQGVGGGYRLRAGKEVPPLLLDDAEAITVAVSLLTGAQSGVRGTEEAALGVLTKLDRVLPARLGEQVRALTGTVESFDDVRMPVDARALMTLARACRDEVEVGFDYPSGTEVRNRRVEPYRLVASGGRWYLLAFDTGAADWRTFRVDRMTQVAARTWRFRPRPAPEAAAYVQEGVANRAYPRQARFRLAAPAATVRAQIPARAAVVQELDAGHCEVRAGAQDLDFVLLHVALLGHDFDILEPPDLADRAQVLAERLAAAAGRGPRADLAVVEAPAHSPRSSSGGG